MKRQIFAIPIILVAFSTIAMLIPSRTDAVSPSGKVVSTWARIKAGRGSVVRVEPRISEGETVVRAAPAIYPGKVKDGIYYPLPGHPGYGYFLYVRPMTGPDGGIELFLLPMGIEAGMEDVNSIRLAIWALKGYYATGGSQEVFPYNSQYVSSIANEIKAHCECYFIFEDVSPRIAQSANPINIEVGDHPGYEDSWLRAIEDWWF